MKQRKRREGDLEKFAFAGGVEQGRLEEGAQFSEGQLLELVLACHVSEVFQGEAARRLGQFGAVARRRTQVDTDAAGWLEVGAQELTAEALQRAQLQEIGGGQQVGHVGLAHRHLSRVHKLEHVVQDQCFQVHQFNPALCVRVCAANGRQGSWISTTIFR